jgi:hypothetical protein
MNPLLSLFAQLTQDEFAFLEARGYRLTQTQTFVDRGVQLVYTTETRFVRIDYDSFDGAIDVHIGVLPMDRSRDASLHELLGLALAASAAERLPGVVRRVAAALEENAHLLETEMPTPDVVRYRIALTAHYAGKGADRPRNPEPKPRSP